MEVANVVASIISAFGNGKDLFRRILGKKSKRKGREATLSEQEAWLRDSLDRRPQQIRDSYNSSLARFGHRFETGDSAAHSSLAHTLLVLNSGLIGLINHVLHRDAKCDAATSRALYDLSEAAANGTFAALSQLNLRLASQSALNLRTLREAGRSEGDEKKNDDKHTRKSRSSPTPVIRGAWVRPKSSSVVITSGSKPIKNRTSHDRSKSEGSLPISKKQSSKSSTRTPSSERPGYTSTNKHRRRKHHSPPKQELSVLVLQSGISLPLREDAAGLQDPPPRPPKIALQSRPYPDRGPRLPSATTFMTTSTKIGEIRGSRSAYNMPPHSKQQVIDPGLVQYVDEQGAHVEDKPKKIKRGFKFWKRPQMPVAIPAC